MIWWLKLRFLPQSALLIAGCILVALYAQGSVMPVPSLVGGAAVALPIDLVAPLLGACAVLYGMGRSDRRVEETAERDTQNYDRLALCLLVLAVLAVCVTLQGTGVWPYGVGFWRNLTSFLALGTLSGLFMDRHLAPLTPAAFLFVCALLGSDGTGHIRIWAWPVAPPNVYGAAVIAALVFIASLPATSARPPRRR